MIVPDTAFLVNINELIVPDTAFQLNMNELIVPDSSDFHPCILLSKSVVSIYQNPDPGPRTVEWRVAVIVCSGYSFPNENTCFHATDTGIAR